MEGVIQNGRVVSFFPQRNYGFIHGEDGNEYFFHILDIADGRIPPKGSLVAFQTSEYQGKTKAVNVRRLAEVAHGLC